MLNRLGSLSRVAEVENEAVEKLSSVARELGRRGSKKGGNAPA